MSVHPQHAQRLVVLLPNTVAHVHHDWNRLRVLHFKLKIQNLVWLDFDNDGEKMHAVGEGLQKELMTGFGRHISQVTHPSLQTEHGDAWAYLWPWNPQTT